MAACWDNVAADAVVSHALDTAPTFATSASVLKPSFSESVADPDLRRINALVADVVSRERSYECHHCGFRAKQFYWQCPGCKHWETLPYG